MIDAPETITVWLGDLPLTLPPAAIAAIAAAVRAQMPIEPREESSPYLTVAQAAEYLQASRQRVYDLLSARRLPKYKDGSRVLIRRDDLDTHLARER
jgi:excisionase family DNA binding protein